MAVHSAVCFLSLSSGILLTRQEHGLLTVITSDAAGGVMARQASFRPPSSSRWRWAGSPSSDNATGLHGPEFSVYLIVIWSIISFATLTWWNSGSLYRLDLERRRAEEAAEKGRAQLAEAQHIAHVGSTEWDILTNSVTWSDELYRIFGYEPGEVPPGLRIVHERRPPDDRKLVEQGDRDQPAHRVPVCVRLSDPSPRRRRASGARGGPDRPRRMTASRPASSAPPRTLQTASRSNTRCARARRAPAPVIDTANDAFIAIDAAGVITDWNPQAETTFGWSREEAIGRTLAELIIPAEHRDAHIEGLHRYVVTGNGPILNKRIELQALDRRDASFRWR